MLWKLINFFIDLPPEWTPSAKNVFPFSDFSINESSLPNFRVKASPVPLKTESSEKDILFEEKKEGQWRIDWKRKEFLCYFYPQAHLPYCISSLVVKIIKIFGENLGLYFCHSACVIKNNQAWLIPGKEGRGKSTLARFLNLPLLNEDLSLVSVQKEVLQVYRVPDPQRLEGPCPFLWEGPFPVKKIILIRREFPEGLYTLPFEDSFRYLLEEDCLLNAAGNEKDILRKWISLCETLLIAYTLEKSNGVKTFFEKY